jgi:hypothetical protein
MHARGIVAVALTGFSGIIAEALRRSLHAGGDA